MGIHFNQNFETDAERIKATFIVLMAAARIKIEKIRANEKAMRYFDVIGRAMLIVLIMTAYTLVIFRVAQKKALDTYAGWLEDYKTEQAAQAEREAAYNPYNLQSQQEAEELARMLYGIKDNDTDDLRTACWCVFNRVDNTAFPDTVQDVIAQPDQWMRYDPTNPVLQNLYKIAYEQLEAWHSDTHRIVAAEYVFMNWSKDDIVLRDNWAEGSGTHYWRWGQ
jgi:hypothetical protein